MRYLITGGAGFIGSHLAEELVRDGEQVTIIDDLSTGSIENIEHLKSEVRFRYIIDTVLNRRLMAELIDWADIVFHLAAVVGVKLVIESPVKAIETNVKTAEVVFELAAKKSKRVLITSTSEVYGKREDVPFSEEDDLVLGPTSTARWSYACSKVIDEFLGLAYWKERGLPVVVARLFNIIGPRQSDRYGMVIPNLIKQALRDEPITVFGDGTQTRCFSWVGDAVDALIKLAKHPRAVGEVFNLGSDEEVRIIDVAQLIKQLTGSNSEIVLVPYDEAYGDGFEDMRRRVPDLTKIRNLIGYHPTLRLPDMISLMIEYYEAQLIEAGRRGNRLSALFRSQWVRRMR